MTVSHTIRKVSNKHKALSNRSEKPLETPRHATPRRAASAAALSRLGNSFALLRREKIRMIANSFKSLTILGEERTSCKKIKEKKIEHSKEYHCYFLTVATLIDEHG